MSKPVLIVLAIVLSNTPPDVSEGWSVKVIARGTWRSASSSRRHPAGPVHADKGFLQLLLQPDVPGVMMFKTLPDFVRGRVKLYRAVTGRVKCEA
jgi:hypothetical protein